MKIKATRVYRVRLDFDYDSDDWLVSFDKLVDKLHKWADENSVEYNSNTGGPCWHAYFVLESQSKESVELVANMTANFILKQKGGKVLL